jgi:hypothetical protein
MHTSGEHKTVQALILEYAEAIGLSVVSREKADQVMAGWARACRKIQGDSVMNATRITIKCRVLAYEEKVMRLSRHKSRHRVAISKMSANIS